MQNSSILKNELIFQYASGTVSVSKSLMAATYLFLNSRESLLYNEYKNYCGEEFENISQVKPSKLTFQDCINQKPKNMNSLKSTINPINNLIGNLNNLKWKKIFGGFYEFSFKVSNKENVKLIKMLPGAKVPLHSHNGREYILVLEGNFCDEYGSYSKGDLQVNDSNIKHTPIASESNGCICLTITEEDLVFYGKFAPILNIITFLKSLFALSK